MRDDDDELDDDGPEIDPADMARFLAEMSEEGLTGEELSRRFLAFVAEQSGLDPDQVEASGDGKIVVREPRRPRGKS